MLVFNALHIAENFTGPEQKDCNCHLMTEVRKYIVCKLLYEVPGSNRKLNFLSKLIKTIPTDSRVDV